MGSSGNARNGYLVFTCSFSPMLSSLSIFFQTQKVARSQLCINSKNKWMTVENMMNRKANNKNPDIVTNCIHCFIFVVQQIGE